MWQSITQGQHMNRMNSRQGQWQRQPGTSTDVPCRPESVVCTDQVDYIVYIVPWPSCPPVVGFWPPKPCTNPYLHPWNTLTHGKGTGLHRVRVKVGAKTPVGYPCPSLLVVSMIYRKYNTTPSQTPQYSNPCSPLSSWSACNIRWLLWAQAINWNTGRVKSGLHTTT